jgi:hypothetical protein
MCGMDRGDQGGRESSDEKFENAWGSYWFSLSSIWRKLEGRAYAEFARGARARFEREWSS